MTSLEVSAAIDLRRRHAPRRRWWSRKIRCEECGQVFPCPQQLYARSRIAALLAEVLEANRGYHW